jgi:glycosyltransferase involved in cell wall biosynthesis
MSLQATIIISSHNYGRFLRACIDSALAQTHSMTQVIVVDDGSTDDSPEIIRSYGDCITPVLKENGGQASAFNAGFRLSTGDIICFVDSDDTLEPSALEAAAELFEEPGIAKVHWPLWIVNEHGRKNGDVMHRHDLDEGDLREAVIRGGPSGYNWTSTSGNAWSRRLIESVFPMPEEEYRIGPDVYLAVLAPFYGLIRKVAEPQGCYRIHGQNNTSREAFEKRVRTGISFWNHSFGVLSDCCRRTGVAPNIKDWERNSWWHRIDATVREIVNLVPEAASFVLLDEDQWVMGDELQGRLRIDFEYPQNEDAALRELSRVHMEGATHLFISWPAFWWQDEFPGFIGHLRQSLPIVIENDRVMGFDLRVSEATR